jgi:hypothetical protein
MIVQLPPPSGDKTGVTDSNAIRDAIADVERVTFEGQPGVYYVKESIDLGNNGLKYISLTVVDGPNVPGVQTTLINTTITGNKMSGGDITNFAN